LLDLAGPLDLTPLSDPSLETDHTGASETLHGANEPREGFLRGIAKSHGGPAAACPIGSAFSPLVPPFGVARLELIDELGRGGLGIVYLAWQQSLSRLVAVKVVAKEWLASPRIASVRSAEPQPLLIFSIPILFRFYHLAKHENWLYGILEYLEGGSLADRLKGVPMQARPAAILLRTLVRAVAFVHEKGFVHRTSKPANILFQGRRNPQTC